MPIKDVLNNKYEAGDRLSFDVDLSVNEKSVRTLTTPNNFVNANLRETFQDGDNIFLESIRILTPYLPMTEAIKARTP